MPDAKKLASRGWTIVAVGFGCVLFGFLAYTTYSSAVLVLRGEKTEARCTNIETKTSGSGSNRSTTTTWTVSYKLADGTTQSGTVDASFSGIKVGDTIEVLYDPQRPDRVQANRFMSLWMYPLMGFGVLALVGYGFLRQRIRGVDDTRGASRSQRSRRRMPAPSSAERGPKTRPFTLRRWFVVLGLMLVASLASWLFDQYWAGHRYAVGAAAFHPNGQQLVTAGSDNDHCELIVWDLPQLAKRRTIPVEQGRVKSIAVSSQGVAVVRCDPPGIEYDDYPPCNVSVVDLAQGKVKETFREPAMIGGTLLHDEMNQLVLHGPDTVQVRSLMEDTTRSLPIGTASGINQVALSADQQHLAAGADQSVVVWRFAERGDPLELPAAGIDVGMVAISPRGQYVAASASSYARLDAYPVLLWHTTSGTDAVRLGTFEQPVHRLAFLPGTPPRLLVIHGSEHIAGHIDIYDVRGQLIESVYDEKSAIKASDLSDDGRRLVVCTAGGEDHAWDLRGERAKPLWSKAVGDFSEVHLAPGSETFTGHGYVGKEVQLFSAADGKRQASRPGYHISQVTRLLLYAVPFIVVLATISALQAYQAKRRDNVFQALARQLGWRLTAGDLPDSLPAFQFTERRSGGHFEHALISQTPTDPLLASYRWTEGSGDRRRVVRQLVAIYPFALPETPDLLIRPESLGDKLAAYVGFEEIDLQASDAQREFSAKYLLRSDAKDCMPDVIHDTLARFLCENAGWNVEVKDGSALVWWQRVKSFSTGRFDLSSADGVRAFLEESRELVRCFAADAT